MQGETSGSAARRAPSEVRWIWLVYALLFGASVPWYLPDGPVPIWLGLPYWVVVSIGAILATACFTLFVVQRCWADDEAAEGDGAHGDEA